jgi:hypothetical protein
MSVGKLQPPVIPFMPLLLKDMTFAHEGNKTSVDGLVNFEKMHMMASTMRAVRFCRSRHLGKFCVISLICTIKLYHTCTMEDGIINFITFFYHAPQFWILHRQKATMRKYGRTSVASVPQIAKKHSTICQRNSSPDKIIFIEFLGN